MANYFRNDLFIQGPEPELDRFESDALPKEGRHGDDSCGGHGEGPLSFLSLLPPPPPLMSDEGAARDALYQWKQEHWGCRFPDTQLFRLPHNVLAYAGDTRNFCAHNFVVSVSRRYPKLAFRLVWWDPYCGFCPPMRYGLLGVQDGEIAADYVELTGRDLMALLAEMNVVLPFEYLDVAKVWVKPSPRGAGSEQSPSTSPTTDRDRT